MRKQGLCKKRNGKGRQKLTKDAYDYGNHQSIYDKMDRQR